MKITAFKGKLYQTISFYMFLKDVCILMEGYPLPIRAPGRSLCKTRMK